MHGDGAKVVVDAATGHTDSGLMTSVGQAMVQAGEVGRGLAALQRSHKLRPDDSKSMVLLIDRFRALDRPTLVTK